MFDSGVTQHVDVLRICVAVLRDVTVLAYGQMSGRGSHERPSAFQAEAKSGERRSCWASWTNWTNLRGSGTQYEGRGGCTADEDEPTARWQGADGVTKHDGRLVRCNWGVRLVGCRQEMSSAQWSFRTDGGRETDKAHNQS